MKQVVFLGFYCQIYKKAPTARIYVGDVMIDEIEIPEYCPEEYMRDGQLSYRGDLYPDKYNIILRDYSNTELSPEMHEKIHKLDNYWWDKFNKHEFKKFCTEVDNASTIKNISHPKIFVYVVDDDILKIAGGKISIDVDNADSDYMNGFMSKSTLIYLSHFYVTPFALFENTISYTQRQLDVFGRVSTSINLKKMFRWYQNKKNNQRWPRNFQHYFMLCNNKTKNKKASENVVGGNVKFQIQMKKKYGIYWPSELMVKGFFWLNRFFIKDFLLPLSHKYKQDENQRDSD